MLVAEGTILRISGGGQAEMAPPSACYVLCLVSMVITAAAGGMVAKREKSKLHGCHGGGAHVLFVLGYACKAWIMQHMYIWPHRH